MKQELQETSTLQQKMTILSQKYPGLYIAVLKLVSETDKIEQYMNKNKAYFHDHIKYSHYIHGYFLLWLEDQREKG